MDVAQVNMLARPGALTAGGAAGGWLSHLAWQVLTSPAPVAPGIPALVPPALQVVSGRRGGRSGGTAAAAFAAEEEEEEPRGAFLPELYCYLLGLATGPILDSLQLVRAYWRRLLRRFGQALDPAPPRQTVLPRPALYA